MAIRYTPPEYNGKDGYWCFKQPTENEPGIWMTMETSFYPFEIKTGKEEGIPEEILELIKKWTEEIAEVIEPDWYIKYASERFVYGDKLYVLYPHAIKASGEQMDAFFNEMERDLKAIGCPYCSYTGMLD